MTDIHHQGFSPGRMSDHGEHGERPRRRRSFTPEFKAEIVELCPRGDRSAGQVAKDFDLTETAVREWVKQAERDAGTRQDGGLTSSERAGQPGAARLGAVMPHVGQRGCHRFEKPETWRPVPGFCPASRRIDPDAEVDDFFTVEPGGMIHTMACSSDVVW